MEEVLNWLINQYDNPSESSKNLAKFIPLPHQYISMTRAQLGGFVPYLKSLKKLREELREQHENPPLQN